MKAGSIDVIPHSALTTVLVDELRELFDRQYLADFGEWDPGQPYGYAPHDVHSIARAGTDIVGHMWGGLIGGFHPVALRSTSPGLAECWCRRMLVGSDWANDYCVRRTGPCSKPKVSNSDTSDAEKQSFRSIDPVGGCAFQWANARSLVRGVWWRIHLGSPS